MVTSGKVSSSLAEPRGAAPAHGDVGQRSADNPRRFRPELVPTLVLLAVLFVTLAAGRWQLDRAAFKVQLQQRIDAAAMAPARAVELVGPGDAASLAWHPIEAVGRFDRDRTVFVDNRLRDGVPGYEVLTPLMLSGSPRVLLVNRGWVAAPLRREQLPEVATPEGEVRVSGLGFVPGTRFMELRADTDDALRWQNWTIERARERWNLDLLPVTMLQTSAAVSISGTGGQAQGQGPAAGTGRTGISHDDGLARQWPRPDVGIDKHRGYALQWFSFAFIAFVVWLALSLRRRTDRGQADVVRVS